VLSKAFTTAGYVFDHHSLDRMAIACGGRNAHRTLCGGKVRLAHAGCGAIVDTQHHMKRLCRSVVPHHQGAGLPSESGTFAMFTLAPGTNETPGVPTMLTPPATFVIPCAAVGTGVDGVFTTVTGMELGAAGAGVLVRKPTATVSRPKPSAISRIFGSLPTLIFLLVLGVGEVTLICRMRNCSVESVSPKPWFFLKMGLAPFPALLMDTKTTEAATLRGFRKVGNKAMERRASPPV
jgi:hypothetical protein